MKIKIKGLETFPVVSGMPQTDVDIQRVLVDPQIKKIYMFVLGPEGTNIAQASRLWVERMNVEEKTEFALCTTPELSLEEARNVSGEGNLAVFWTCAVYAKEHEFFFTNPDMLPFFTQQVMLLDAMQLATRPKLVDDIADGQLPHDWKIASHPSPAPLVRNLGCDVVLVNSNADAAQKCSVGQYEACITTESARVIYGLETLHVFGSPPMVFFGGITAQGARLIQEVWRNINV